MSRVMLEPISKTLPPGLCRNFGTAQTSTGTRFALCLLGNYRSAELERCLYGRICEHYDPEWYGFEDQFEDQSEGQRGR